MDRLNHGIELFPACLEHDVIQINTYIRFIRRDHHDGEAVNFVELGGFRLRRARHPRELIIHPEIILNRNRSVSLGLFFDGAVLFGFNRLVEAV